MTPVVAVIAPGAMGAAVGRRLTDHGLKVVTSLKGRSAETVKRAEAARMVAASDEEIAALLNLSIKTVDVHKYNLMRKIDVHDRTELIKYAIQRRLISVPPTDTL